MHYASGWESWWEASHCQVLWWCKEDICDRTQKQCTLTDTLENRRKPCSVQKWGIKARSEQDTVNVSLRLI